MYGLIIIISGIFLLYSNNSNFLIIRFILGISLIMSALLAILTTFNKQTKPVQFSYHTMHALSMMAYGLALNLFCNTNEKLISFTAILLIFYTFSEIIFVGWLFNLKQRVKIKIAVLRSVLGLIIGIGTIAAMNYEGYTLHAFGILFIMVGINVMLYVPIMKASQSIETEKELQQ